ncbi:DUF389 domain-containing protein [Pedobacter sp. ASV12]|uniref:DUF389 domain-containing protein n=1 Tax=Pedobacter sp. ASV12 TaxID=2795120 RepID=UPI0018ECBAA9|nr:DUF389 domain-containing protein [Pedobacter sp. ASV12]
MNIWNSLFNLKRGEDEKENVLANIRANISFKGANLWILACAILIASVGLNVNSTAVIIGAMLISPLMGPIVGAGFALGMFDFQLLKRSLLNLLIATIAGLIVSAVYFFFTPFKDAQSELLARTAPNIYDVLIAFFGGLVGVIAVTRVDKGNPIPGVAIATALMPPLCTAGFGIATGNWKYAAGALFLYAINCTFICIATYLIVKLLKYPSIKVEEKQERRVHWLISLLIVLMIAPSVYFAYTFYKEQQFRKNVRAFISKEFEEKGNTVIYQKTNYSINPKTIELAFLAKKFTPDEIYELNGRLPHYRLADARLIIRQDSTFLAQNLQKTESGNEKQSGHNEQLVISRLQKELQAYQLNATNLMPEARAIFPAISGISIGKMQVLDNPDSLYMVPAAIYSSEKPLPGEEEKKLKSWLKAKLFLDTLTVYRKK